MRIQRGAGLVVGWAVVAQGAAWAGAPGAAPGTVLGPSYVLAPQGVSDPSQASPGDSDDEIAIKLQNPVAALVSVPLQSNLDFKTGRDNDGFRYTLNVQPVIPFSLGEEWNLITRTIVPIVYQNDVVRDGGDDQFGIGDAVQSFFFSPKAPGPGGVVWGVGPVFLWPTGTNDSLGSGKWGAGPTGVVFAHVNSFNLALLANHIWSYAGEGNRAGVNRTLIQPSVSYNVGGGLTIGVNSEMTYDWSQGQWTIPLTLNIAKVTSIGGQRVSFSGGPRYWVEGPDGAPRWGLRFGVTFVFPK